MNIATEIQRLQTAKADIKTAIEEKGVAVGDGLIDFYAEKIGEISGGGDNPLNYASFVGFDSLNVFGKAEVILDLGKVPTLERLFYVTTSENKNTTVERLTINHSGSPTSMYQMIYSNGSSSNDTVLKTLILNIDTSNCTTFNGLVQGRLGLVTIGGTPLDFSSNIETTISPFTMCYQLTDFRVVKETIKKHFNISYCDLLSNETIESIIEGLFDLTGGATQTLTFGNQVGNRLTEAQKAVITAKNWILAY